jgi:S1-C subfamily serine protease
MLRSVVTILVQRADGSAQGSGVIVDPSGVIATAAHVLAGATSARVRLASGDVLTVEGIIDTDPERDIALLRVAGFQLPIARLGNSDSLTLGQRLLAIGTPIGFETTVADGLLSGIRTDSTGRFLQISIPVSHGSSGGPVLTEQGLVVGLVVSGFRGDVAQGINFAVPINYVRGRLALAARKPPVPLSESGRLLG